MTKKILLLTTLSAIWMAAQSQTLFTYGNKPVSKEEFLQAYNKNPTPDTTNRKAALRSYLDLFINYKLKVQSAYDEKLDNSEQYRSESASFKSQLADAAVNNEANLNSLVEEAYQRSQKDLFLMQLFVPAGGDTTAARQKADAIYTALKEGKKQDVDIEETPVGWVTAFTLPYQLENIIYALTPGAFTAPYRSSAGYHLFILKEERPAAGTRKVQQILFAVSPAFSDEEKTAVARLADSVYQSLQNGASFTALQQQYSGLQQAGKTTTEVSVGQYSPEFEKAVFSLQKEGDISTPFATAYGYNIVKLVEKVPAAFDAGDITARGMLQEKVIESDRLQLARQALANHWKKQIGYTAAPYTTAALWQYTDSVLNDKPVTGIKNMGQNTVLFSFPKQKITVSDWLQYVRQQQGTDISYDQLMRNFEQESIINYYKKNIEFYNAAVRPQLEEFDYANLLFAAMDKHVWTQASQDSTGLHQYYTINREKYPWAPGASAIVVNAESKELANEIAVKIKNKPAVWRTLADEYGGLVQADSSRFEWEQLPLKNKENLHPGYVSAPLQNDMQDGYLVIYITRLHTTPDLRNFDDAKGLVINDYQQVVEEKWLNELKKKYPVVINKQVANSLE